MNYNSNNLEYNYNPNYLLKLLCTGGFYFKTPIKTYIVTREFLVGDLFLLGVTTKVREAIVVEINELTSNYWEFDKNILLRSEWKGGMQ
jgi:hypothetical protein